VRDLKIYSYSTTHSITIHKQAINDRCTPVPFRKKEKGMAARFGMEEIDGDCKVSKQLLQTGTVESKHDCRSAQLARGRSAACASETTTARGGGKKG